MYILEIWGYPAEGMSSIFAQTLDWHALVCFSQTFHITSAIFLCEKWFKTDFFLLQLFKDDLKVITVIEA